MIVNVGDIIEIDGKKYEVTFVCGDNYSYKDYLGPKEPEEPKEAEHVVQEQPKRRTRRK